MVLISKKKMLPRSLLLPVWRLHWLAAGRGSLPRPADGHGFAHTPGSELRVAGEACRGSSRGLTQPCTPSPGPTWPWGPSQYRVIYRGKRLKVPSP